MYDWQCKPVPASIYLTLFLSIQSFNIIMFTLCSASSPWEGHTKIEIVLHGFCKVPSLFMMFIDVPLTIETLYELRRNKTKKVACARIKDSDQPDHQSSLIKVFAVRLKGSLEQRL